MHLSEYILVRVSVMNATNPISMVQLKCIRQIYLRKQEMVTSRQLQLLRLTKKETAMRGVKCYVSHGSSAKNMIFVYLFLISMRTI